MGLIFVIVCESFLLLHNLMSLLQHIESIYYLLLIGFIVDFLFCLQSGKFTYDPSRFGFIL